MRAYDRRRGSRQQRGYDADWERARRLVLERDHYECQIRGPHCTFVATTVDHVVALVEGGSRLDPANLRAACARDNYSLGGQKRRQATRRAGYL